MKRLWFLRDIRRWRAAWGSLTDDAVVLVAIRETHERLRDLVVAIAPDDAWPALADLAEHRLPDAIRGGMLVDLDRWLSGELPAAAEPTPGSQPELEDRLDPRRSHAMRDACSAPAFVGIAVWPDGDRATTLIADTTADRLDVFAALEVVAAQMHGGHLDTMDGRTEWIDTDAAGDAA